MEILDKFNIKHGVGKEEYVNKTQVRAWKDMRMTDEKKKKTSVRQALEPILDLLRLITMDALSIQAIYFFQFNLELSWHSTNAAECFRGVKKKYKINSHHLASSRSVLRFPYHTSIGVVHYFPDHLECKATFKMKPSFTVPAPKTIKLTLKCNCVLRKVAAGKL